MWKAQMRWIVVAVAWHFHPAKGFSFNSLQTPMPGGVPSSDRNKFRCDSCHREEAKDTQTSAQKVASRRTWLAQSMLTLPAILSFHSQPSSASDSDSGTSTTVPFRTKAYNLKEYTNAIVASKDTNVSPKEAYDVLAETIAPMTRKDLDLKRNRALDVGAGAGVSTQTLFEMGFTNMDAVDWSGLAWNANVVDCPPSVKFYEMDDERFFTSQKGKGDELKYQIIVYNFAINLDKAVRIAKEYLDPELENNARLLAPANAQQDYWYKQTYYLIDAKGEIVWKSKPDVGAWSVQFQPDVTSDTCQGIWCPPYNGFVKQR
jgi:hypothetical protein